MLCMPCNCFNPLGASCSDHAPVPCYVDLAHIISYHAVSQQVTIYPYHISTYLSTACHITEHCTMPCRIIYDLIMSYPNVSTVQCHIAAHHANFKHIVSYRSVACYANHTTLQHRTRPQYILPYHSKQHHSILMPNHTILYYHTIPHNIVRTSLSQSTLLLPYHIIPHNTVRIVLSTLILLPYHTVPCKTHVTIAAAYLHVIAFRITPHHTTPRHLPHSRGPAHML